jgi:hypothetical protein
MQPLWWIAQLVTVVGLGLMVAAFSPLGRGRAGLLRHPWLLGYGLAVFILGELLQLIHGAMTR